MSVSVDYCIRSTKSKPSSSRSPTKNSASSQMMSDSRKYKSAEFVVDSDDSIKGEESEEETPPPAKKGEDCVELRVHVLLWYVQCSYIFVHTYA